MNLGDYDDNYVVIVPNDSQKHACKNICDLLA